MTLYVAVYKNGECRETESYVESYEELEEFFYEIYGADDFSRSRVWRSFQHMIVYTETPDGPPLLGIWSKDRIDEMGREWRHELVAGE